MISYDLVGATPSAAYRIELFSSIDNFNNPLRLVSGNVGDGVTAGHKIIEWNAGEELGIFEREIMFEVKGYAPKDPTKSLKPLSFIQPTTVSKVVRKKSVPVQWTGGDSHSKVNIELCRNNEVISTIGYSLPNTGKASWTVSKSTLQGKNYYLRIIDVGNPENRTVSQNFRIRNPANWAAWLLIVVAGGSYFILQAAK